MKPEDHNWQQITVEEAREVTERLVWWCPEMRAASLENPDEDPAYVAE